MMARKAKEQKEKEHLHWQETFRVFTTPSSLPGTIVTNKEGKEVTEEGELVEDDFEPFLDDSGKPVPVPEKETEEETTEETAEVEENTPKKRGRPKKTEEVS